MLKCFEAGLRARSGNSVMTSFEEVFDFPIVFPRTFLCVAYRRFSYNQSVERIVCFPSAV